ncbi:CRISPR-associated protein Cas4 [Psychroflexus halocasei]|uniref:CRISPR-associated exonuclease Cas4 n=1 Tax=Psychroflexus halocasei TaxID=908615 RepID=A0A1H4CHG7_9FLAO|nr:CRISPR-associated protein Cas4 [Psychroflexus halocasei]SEA59769.1 CRISPR-associated exonuclease Cas4 [Psychroflexus halocasei]
MLINATHINLLHVCHRELWLHYHGVRMEHTSQTVAEGKLIGETSYPERAKKYTELAMDGIKIDFYDPKENVVHEVKKSNKVEEAHIAQVKYYLYILRKNGIEDPSAIIEYPKLRQRQVVEWEDGDTKKIEAWKQMVEDIVTREECPPLLHARICRSCSYFDFCYSDQPDTPSNS